MKKLKHPATAEKVDDKRRDTVFVSGTDRVRDVLSQIYTGLKRMRFRPWWFAKPDFPHFPGNAMDTCLEAARRCDRFVLVLDERAGLAYGQTGITITEAEFNIAHERNIPTLIFIRSRVWHQSRVYHRWRSNGKIDERRYKSIMLDGDQEVYEFIERIQHKTRNGEANIPWITPFDLGEEVVKAIRAKWLITDKDQLDVLRALRVAAPIGTAAIRPITGRVGHIHMSRHAMEFLGDQELEGRKHLLAALEAIERGAATDPQNPLGIKHLASGFSGKRVMSFNVGDFRVILSTDRPDRIVVQTIYKHK